MIEDYEVKQICQMEGSDHDCALVWEWKKKQKLVCMDRMGQLKLIETFNLQKSEIEVAIKQSGKMAVKDHLFYHTNGSLLYVLDIDKQKHIKKIETNNTSEIKKLYLDADNSIYMFSEYFVNKYEMREYSLSETGYWMSKEKISGMGVLEYEGQCYLLIGGMDGVFKVVRGMKDIIRKYRWEVQVVQIVDNQQWFSKGVCFILGCGNKVYTAKVSPGLEIERIQVDAVKEYDMQVQKIDIWDDLMVIGQEQIIQILKHVRGHWTVARIVDLKEQVTGISIDSNKVVYLVGISGRVLKVSKQSHKSQSIQNMYGLEVFDSDQDEMMDCDIGLDDEIQRMKEQIERVKQEGEQGWTMNVRIVKNSIIIDSQYDVKEVIVMGINKQGVEGDDQCFQYMVENESKHIEIQCGYIPSTFISVYGISSQSQLVNKMSVLPVLLNYYKLQGDHDTKQQQQQIGWRMESELKGREIEQMLGMVFNEVSRSDEEDNEKVKMRQQKGEDVIDIEYMKGWIEIRSSNILDLKRIVDWIEQQLRKKGVQIEGDYVKYSEDTDVDRMTSRLGIQLLEQIRDNRDLKNRAKVMAGLEEIKQIEGDESWNQWWFQDYQQMIDDGKNVDIGDVDKIDDRLVQQFLDLYRQRNRLQARQQEQGIESIHNMIKTNKIDKLMNMIQSK